MKPLYFDNPKTAKEAFDTGEAFIKVSEKPGIYLNCRTASAISEPLIDHECDNSFKKKD